MIWPPLPCPILRYLHLQLLCPLLYGPLAESILQAPLVHFQSLKLPSSPSSDQKGRPIPGSRFPTTTIHPGIKMLQRQKRNIQTKPPRKPKSSFRSFLFSALLLRLDKKAYHRTKQSLSLEQKERIDQLADRTYIRPNSVFVETKLGQL